MINVLMLFGACCSGCTVGPNYKRPEVPVQNRWAQMSSNLATTIDETSPPADWWVTLSDEKLSSLVWRAWRGDLDIRIAKSRIEESRAFRAIATSGLYPSLGASGSYDFYRANGPFFPVETGDYNFYLAGFDAVWEADIFGGIRRNIEAAQDDLEAQVEAKRGAMVSVFAEVARNYVELRAAQQRQIIVQANISTQAETLALAKRLKAAGIVSDLDITRAQTELTQTKSQLPVLKIEEKSAIHQIGVLLGEAPEALERELQQPGPVPSPRTRVPIGLPSELLQRRPDVREVERELAAATARIGVAEADLYPKVTLTGDLGVGSQQFGSLFNWSNRYVGIGPSIEWQLFEGGRIVANIDAHRAIRQELLDDYKLTILSALGETENALVSLNQRQEEYQLVEQSVESSRESVRIASDRYAGGTVDYLTLLDAQRSLLETEDTLVVSQGDIALSVIALYKAIGGGWEKMEQREKTVVAARSPQ